MNNLDETLREQECEGSKHYTMGIVSNIVCAFCGQTFRVAATNQIPPHYRRSN